MNVQSTASMISKVRLACEDQSTEPGSKGATGGCRNVGGECYVIDWEFHIYAQTKYVAVGHRGGRPVLLLKSAEVIVAGYGWAAHVLRVSGA